MSPGPSIQRRTPIVIWFGRVGDMVLLSTLLDILLRRYGNPCRLIGAGSWSEQIYQDQPCVTQVHCLRRHTPFLFDGSWWRTLRQLRQLRSDPVYVCEVDADKLARVRRLLRLSGTDPRRCLFLGDEPGCRQPHWVDRLAAFGQLTPPALRPADFPWPPVPPAGAPRLQVGAAARAECESWCEEQGCSARPLVLVQPGNRRTMRGRKLRIRATDDKSWPLERWAQLLQRIQAHMPEAAIVLCGAPKESLLLRWIREATPLPQVFVAEVGLRRLFALCGVAHSMISVDTGPAHAAAALGLPLAVMFGAQSQAQWLPRSGWGSPVTGIGGPPATTRLDQITVDEVFEAWRSLPPRDSAGVQRRAQAGPVVG